MDLPDKPDPILNNEQRDAWQKMRKLLSNQVESDKAYDALKDSRSGSIISTDIARHLDKRYAMEPKKGSCRDLKPSWDLAWRYAEDRFLREIQNRNSRKMVRLMAGGWAAGKTHALSNEKTIPDFVWDGTLSRPVWAASMIEIALHNGWKVEIAYIYRNLELAMYGAIERSQKTGRKVPLSELPKSHREAQQSIIDLTQVYAVRKGVSFLYLHNIGKKGAIADAINIDLKELETYGALRYLERHEEYYKNVAKHLS